MNVYRGLSRPLRQRFREHFSPTTGARREYEYKGFDRRQMVQLANAYARAGCEYEFVDEHGVFTLHATDPYGELIIDTWEVSILEDSPSALANPRNGNIPQGYLELIGKAVEDNSTIEEAGIALTEATGDIYALSIQDNPAAVRLFKRMKRGEKNFFSSRYILKHTTNVSNRWAGNISDANVWCLYSTAHLLTETGSPNLWTYPLPGRLASKILELEAHAIAVFGYSDDYAWSWMKRPSSEATAANFRINIVTEYMFYRWSLDEYYFAG